MPAATHYRPFGDLYAPEGVFIGFGFYPAETDGRNWWRWTGPGQLAQIRIALAQPGRYCVAICASGHRRYCGRPAAATVSPGNGSACILCEAWTPEPHFAGWLDLELLRALPERAADGRMLGLCVGSIGL